MDINELIKRKIQIIGKKVNAELPKNCGFVVLATPFNPDGKPSELMYVSNCNRNDIVKLMIEWIIKTKGNFGNDTGKY